MTTLLDYCVTDKESASVDAYLKKGTFSGAAKLISIDRTTLKRQVKRVKERAALQGYSPENDMVHTVPDTHFVKGTSTLYGEDGKPRLQWVKSDKKAEDQHKVMKEIANALSEALPVFEPKSANHKYQELLAVYPMGDPHIGLLCWEKETGDNHNLEIGTRELCQAVDRLVNTAPHCKEALIINTGDYYHSDNMDNKTSRSGHSLDVDGRWSKILEAGIDAMRQCIESALERHEKVTVINVIGNHDDHSAMFLSVCLSNMYKNEPRVTINKEPTATHYYKFGKNLIGTTHGHSIKSDKLPLVMATERPSDWGNTEYRVWYTGHVHHDSVKEYNGCTVETVRTLAAKDFYAVSHGYHAKRDMKCVIHHKEFGEVERHTVGLNMLRNA